MESKAPVMPTTLDGIKRSAKRLKRELALKHAQAMDLSAPGLRIFAMLRNP